MYAVNGAFQAADLPPKTFWLISAESWKGRDVDEQCALPIEFIVFDAEDYEPLFGRGRTCRGYHASELPFDGQTVYIYSIGGFNEYREGDTVYGIPPFFKNDERD